jgi:hypothetical protein
MYRFFFSLVYIWAISRKCFVCLFVTARADFNYPAAVTNTVTELQIQTNALQQWLLTMTDLLRAMPAVTSDLVFLRSYPKDP